MNDQGDGVRDGEVPDDEVGGGTTGGGEVPVGATGGDATGGDATGTGGSGGDVPAGPVAGWYPDPDVHGGQRYWDGNRWTDLRRTPTTGPGAAPPGAAPGAGPGVEPPGATWGAPAPAAWGGRAAYGGAAAPAAPIDTWLWQSILATIFCCQPFGIVAIVFSAMAGSARDAGNWAVARQRADQARTWTLVSVATVVVIFVGFLGFVALGLLFGA